MLYNLSNCTIDIQRVANYKLYNIEPGIVKPQPPEFFIESQNRTIQNLDHPDYVEGLQLYQIAKVAAINDYIISTFKLVKNNNKQFETYWVKLKKTLIQNDLYDVTKGDDFYFIKFVLLADNLTTVIENVCLTESYVLKMFNSIPVLKYGVSIIDSQLQFTIKTGIEYPPVQIGNDILVNPIDEWNACVASGMNWSKWIKNKYSLEEMAVTVAIYRLNRLTELHSQDESIKEQERASKKG